jgi:hypothetical protein
MDVPQQPARPPSRPTVHHVSVRSLGIDLLGARNTALQSLVVEVPPPLIAELLGYSYNVTQRHAEIAAQPWERYVTSPPRPAHCRTSIEHGAHALRG